MIIEVTAEDIRLGTPSYGNCPISRAAKRAFNREIVNTDFPKLYVGIDLDTPCGVYDLPPEARVFIHDFDGERIVKPFTFEVGVSHEDRGNF